MVAEETDMISVLVQDHHLVEQLFAELERGEGDPSHRRSLADRMITELVRHSVAEEEYLYPATRDALPGGDALADGELREHEAIERLMKSLEGVDPADPAFDYLLAQLIVDVRGHFAEEEADLFPRLRIVCTPQELAELGERIERAKRLGPTRPHPVTPDTPPLNRVLDPAAGLVDRVRDALAGRAR
jgi:hemerythrin superfamily protein